MTFDSKEQRDLIWQLILQANFPGAMVEQIVALKQAIQTACITEPPQVEVVR